MNNNTLSSIFTELSQLDEDTFPPVEEWNPPLCENIEMKIDRSGKWYFMNSPIGRERMVKLFSRVLRKDNDEYFLVTPVEKIKIHVEDKPFVIIDFEVNNFDDIQTITLKTNTEEVFIVNEEHPIRIEINPSTNEPSPYVLVRKNLEGLLTRSVYYGLIEICEEVAGNYGIYSSGNFFHLN